MKRSNENDLNGQKKTKICESCESCSYMCTTDWSLDNAMQLQIQTFCYISTLNIDLKNI